MPASSGRQVAAVIKDDLRQGVNSPRTLLVLGSYLLFSVLLPLPYVVFGGLVGGPAVGEASGAGEGLALASVPLPALYSAYVASLCVPVLAALVACDLLADDLRTGHVRYLSPRCGRAALLWGRLASRALMLTVTVLLGALASYLLFALRTQLPAGAAGHFGRYGLLLAAIGTSYVALTALLSTMAGSSLSALVASVLAGLALGLVDLTSSTLGWATPNHYKSMLLSADRWPSGLAGYAGFALACGVAAWLRLRTRDL